MTIPFLDLVRKAKEKFEAKRRPAGLAPLPSVQDKPESDKLAKRVTPYAVRTMTPEPSAPALAASAIATRRISVTRPSAGAPPDLGPRVGVSVEPRGERTLSLALSDVIAEMPNGYLKPHESFDTSRRITLKAAEVEKGLAAGRPSISIAAIYQQAPEIFLHTVQPSDTAVVMLPAKKVIDELSHLRVREDQTAEPIMAQVETPFLKMMVEESAKFGTKLAPFTTTELPPLPEPVSSAPAAAEPAPVAAIRPPPASRPIQPSPAMKLPVQPPPAARPPAQPPPVAPTTSRTIPPPPCRDGADPRRFDGAHYFCCTECTGGKQAGKTFTDWNGWARVSASSSLQRASRSSRRTTGRCADANSIPNAAVGCAAESRGANAGSRTADNLRPGSRDAKGCAGCRNIS